jgi:hypothetical protein
VLEWITGLLALMTGWLAWETRDMARATKKIATLSAEPYLSLGQVHVEGRRLLANGPNSPTIGFVVVLVLRNPGQVRICFEVKNFVVALDGKRYPPSAFDSRGGYIHPTEETNFFYPFVESSTQLTPGLTGTVEFEAAFWAVERERHSMALKVLFSIVGLEDGKLAVKWHYTSGPEFT